MSIKKLNEIIDSPIAELGTTIIDYLSLVPFGSMIVSIYKTGVMAADCFLFKKFAHFLEPVSGEEEKVDAYLDNLSGKDRDKLGEYMLTLLTQAESSEKARIMGQLFKSAVHREIDHEMMLRLVSVVGRAFVSDFKELPNYLKETEDFSIAANVFINFGIIDNEIGGYWKNTPTVVLNEVGKTLYHILEKEDWFNKQNGLKPQIANES